MKRQKGHKNPISLAKGFTLPSDTEEDSEMIQAIMIVKMSLNKMRRVKTTTKIVMVTTMMRMMALM